MHIVVPRVLLYFSSVCVNIFFSAHVECLGFSHMYYTTILSVGGFTDKDQRFVWGRKNLMGIERVNFSLE